MPYAGLEGLGGFEILKFEGNDWKKVTAEKPYADYAERIYMDSYDGSVYAAYGAELQVMRLVGDGWVRQGSGLAGKKYGYDPKMCRDEKNKTIYIAFEDNFDYKKGNGNYGLYDKRLTVMKCRNGSWSIAGKRQISEMSAEDKFIEAYDGKVYVIYSQKKPGAVGGNYRAAVLDDTETWLDKLISGLPVLKWNADKPLKKEVKTPPPSKKGIKEAVFTKEQLEKYYHVYKNPFVKHLRRALNIFLEGKKEAEVAFGPDTEKYSEYLKGKFIVLTINRALGGGCDMLIIFQDKPDKVFYAWVYKLAGEEGKDEYELRTFKEYDKVNAGDVVKQYRKFIEDKEHSL
jgi:hypothetical protein